MSKCSTRRESEALAVFNVLVNVEELLEVSAKKSSKLHVGRVDRLMDHASEPLAGLPHVGAVERPEIDGRLIGAHFVLAKEKAPDFSEAL